MQVIPHFFTKQQDHQTSRIIVGISAPVGDLTPFFDAHNVTAGDLIQFAAAVAITQCPGAPRLSFLSGRPNAKAPAPDGLIPEPTQNVAAIVARFHDAAGFTSDEVVALLASHSIARADHVDPTIQAVPFDSTPFVVCRLFDSCLPANTLITLNRWTPSSSLMSNFAVSASQELVVTQEKSNHLCRRVRLLTLARCACSPTPTLPAIP